MGATSLSTRMLWIGWSIVLINGCTAANPLAVSWPGGKYESEDVTRGVVNGLWEYDIAGNHRRLRGAFAETAPEDARDLASLYQVRVGIDRGVFLFKASEVVVLPAGWKYSLSAVVNDGRTINVGDVVDIRGKLGTSLETIEAIVRKCNDSSVPGENKDYDTVLKVLQSLGVIQSPDFPATAVKSLEKRYGDLRKYFRKRYSNSIIQWRNPNVPYEPAGPNRSANPSKPDPQVWVGTHALRWLREKPDRRIKQLRQGNVEAVLAADLG